MEKEATQNLVNFFKILKEIDDEAKLNKARVIKTAYNHLIDLPKKYKDNLLALEQSLEKENEIEKDYED